MITRIHASGQDMRRNPKKKPVFVVRGDDGSIRQGTRVFIAGPSVAVYEPQSPLTPHAEGYQRPVAWVETEAEVMVQS